MQRERHANGSSSIFGLLDEGAVLIGSAEIHVDALHLVAFKPEELGISKALSAPGGAFVGDEGLVSLDEDSLEFVPLDPVGVAPAAREIGGLVDRVVIRTGEVKIIVQRVLDGLAVIRHVGRKDGADDLGSVLPGHLNSPTPAAVHRELVSEAGERQEPPPPRRYRRMSSARRWRRSPNDKKVSCLVPPSILPNQDRYYDERNHPKPTSQPRIVAIDPYRRGMARKGRKGWVIASSGSPIGDQPAHDPCPPKSRAGNRGRPRHRACHRKAFSRRRLARGAARHRGRIVVEERGGAGSRRPYLGAAVRHLRCKRGRKRHRRDRTPLRQARRGGQQCRRRGVRAAARDLR